MYLSIKGKENWNHIVSFVSLSQNINHIYTYRGCSKEFWVYYFWERRAENKTKTEKKIIASYLSAFTENSYLVVTGLPWIHSNEAEIFISNKTSFLCPNFAYPLKVTGASGGLLGKIWQISQIFSTLLKICCPLYKQLPLFI